MRLFACIREVCSNTAIYIWGKRSAPHRCFSVAPTHVSSDRIYTLFA